MLANVKKKLYLCVVIIEKQVHMVIPKEILEIIKYFPKDEYSKIPKEKIEFYKNNMDKDYSFKINPEIDLSEQNISPEANAIIINLYTSYFATEEQKNKIEEILNLNQQKDDQLKREKYNPDNIFKKENKEIIEESENSNSSSENSLIEQKETFFTKFKKFIFKIFHINL